MQTAEIHAEHQSILARALAWWQERRRITEALAEFHALSSADVSELLTECGVTREQLIAMIKAGPHAADEMAEMMRALNIDSALVHERDPWLYNEMAHECATCGQKKQCRQELAAGTADRHYPAFCANHERMSEFRARPELLLAD